MSSLILSKNGNGTHEEIQCAEGRKIIRFNNLNDLLWYDKSQNNPLGHGVRHYHYLNIKHYVENRFKLTEEKRKIISKARQDLAIDKDFQKLIHKSQSDKRKAVKNKYGGSFLPVEYAKSSDYMFERYMPGKKSTTLNMAFQVGVLSGGDYNSGFVNILKTILMAQAMNIRCNIDMFDSDTRAVEPNGGYVIVNLAKSTEKIDFTKLLISSHPEFFNYSLFNGYSAQNLDRRYNIGTFLPTNTIVKDLNPYYEVIGGNFLHRKELEGSTEESTEMVNQIFKIAWK